MENINANKDIFNKIIKVQSQVSGIKKNRDGHRYKYEDLNSIITILHPLLAEEGLCIVHDIQPLSEGEYLCVTRVYDDVGNYVESRCPIVGVENLLVKGNPMQGMGSAITYSRRYNLKNLFNLFSTDDDAASMAADGASEKQIKLITDLLEKLNGDIDYDAFYKVAGTRNLQELSMAKAKQLITMLMKKVKDAGN